MFKTEIENLTANVSNDTQLGYEVRKYVSENNSTEDDFKDKYLRLSAEFDNFRKRVLKEKEDLIIKTKSSVLESILEIDSDLSLALKNTNDLLSQGRQTIQTTTYDADIHDVISIVSTGQKDKIIDVVSKGYMINDKIIKHPKVVLSY